MPESSSTLSSLLTPEMNGVVIGSDEVADQTLLIVSSTKIPARSVEMLETSVIGGESEESENVDSNGKESLSGVKRNSFYTDSNEPEAKKVATDERSAGDKCKAVPEESKHVEDATPEASGPTGEDDLSKGTIEDVAHDQAVKVLDERSIVNLATEIALQQ